MKISWMKNSVAAFALASTAFLGVVPASVDGHGDTKHIMAAIEHAERSAEDKARDKFRKPAKILAFSGIKPGMTVLDINAGGGYYSEILARSVGDEGTVYTHNGPVYYEFFKKAVETRYKDRLSNVKRFDGVSENITVPEASVDVVIAVLAYHDYFFKTKVRTEDENMPEILGSIYKSMKPGGSFVVVDHVAPAGSGPEAGNTLHRIDPELVKEQMLAAGFKLAETSDVLKNPEDDHTSSPFGEGIRGKTDRFVFKFVK